MKVCVQTRVLVRRAQRHPLSQKAHRIQKRATRDVGMGIVPSALNDLVFHHAQLSMDEVIHAAQDTMVVTALAVVIRLLLVNIEP